MTSVRIPKFNSNDSAYVLVEWLVEDGAEVVAGQEVAQIETSKAVVELTSPDGGVLSRHLAERAECGVGDVVAELHPDRESYAREQRAAPEAAVDDQQAAADVSVLTRAARELADERGIPHDRLHALGRRVVKRGDVELLLTGGGAGQGESDATSVTDLPLPATQRAVAATVRESHRTVPAAFVAMKVEVTAALAHATRLSGSEQALIGLPELVVAAVASLHQRHPLCFASIVDEEVVRTYAAAQVGVTIDTGNGLTVATVRDTATLSCAQIAHRLMELRLRSVRQNFRSQDLTGSNVVVALHNEDDVVMARPIVFPAHTCSFVLTGTLEEVVLDENGRPSRRKVVHLGLAYDHRVLNGRDATAALRELKRAIESPAGIAAGEWVSS